MEHESAQPESTPVAEQQQQQQAKPVAFAMISEIAIVTDRGIRMHLVGIDVDGGLWERWDDEKPGVWHEVPRPTR